MPEHEWNVLTQAQYDTMIEQLAEDVAAACDKAGVNPRRRLRKLESFISAAKLIRMAIFEEGGFE